MRNAAYRRRVQALATGAIAVVAAASQAVPAQADDTQNTNHNSAKTLNNAHPTWATADKDRGAVPASQTITTRVFLTGQDSDGLAAFARAVNDPNSPQYGQYLTPEQVKQQFGTTPAQLSAVQGWLKDAGLSISSVSTNWIDATGDPAAVQRAFGTQVKNYQRPDGTIGYAASSAAVIPASVASYVSTVSGLTQNTAKATVDSVHSDKPNGFSKNADASKTGATSKAVSPAGSNAPNSGCGAYFGSQTVTGFPAGSNGANLPLLPCAYSPQQLRQAYGLNQGGKTGKGATIAIVDWYASPTMYNDANAWSADHGIQQFRPGQYTEWLNRDGWNNQNNCADAKPEEALDVEMAHGLAPDANIVYVGANSCMDNDLMAAEQTIVDKHLADVVSNSWGSIMHSVNGNEDPAVMASYDKIFQQGAAEGISFTFSSGDCGDDAPGLKAGGGINCSDNTARRQTEWPVSSQWVTAVGGTTLATKNTSGDYAWEITMGDHWATANAGGTWSAAPGRIPFGFGGGGGTSEDIAQPWYQSGKVPAGLANTESNGNAAARPMRVVPDVAMVGAVSTPVDIAWNDDQYGYAHFDEGGTSAAAPAFAAVLANAKEAAGHAFGFANPSLYALSPSAYHDVVDRPGITEGIRTQPGNPDVGKLYQVGMDTSLSAGPGYDNATGLGSPNGNFVGALAALRTPATPNPNGPTVARVAGDSRYTTAVAVSKKAFPADHSAPAVVIATGGNFPDALAGVPFAKSVNAPLLLTPGNALDAGVSKEIDRVLAGNGQIYILGGNAAVSPAVENALKAKGRAVHRINGADRYETSVAIAKAMGSPTNVVVATGANFPDALAAGPYAADVFTIGNKPAAVLLSQDTKLPASVFDYMDKHITDVAAIGGQAVTALHGVSGVVNFKGEDRYDTAAKVAAAFPHPQVAGVATGLQFADALTGAALLARSNSPLLLTDPKNLSSFTSNALKGLSHSLAGGGSVEIFGGPAAITPAVVNAIALAVGGHVVN